MKATRGTKASAAAAVPVLTGAHFKRQPGSGYAWTLLEVAAILSVTFSAFMVKEALTASAAVDSLPAQIAVPVRVGVLALYYAAQVAVLVWLVRRRSGDVAHALGLRGTARGAVALTADAGFVVATLAATRFFAWLYAYVTLEFGLMPTEGVDLPGLFGTSAGGVVLAVIMVVVVGPVVEEAVFRGALLKGLAARFGDWPAIVIQAAIFSALHRSLWLAVPMLVLGIALGWLANERESLWPPIIAHALYNAVTVAAAFLVATTG